MRDVMLTTSDNPYDPFTQFDEWYSYDTGKGYNSLAYLGRIAKTSTDLSEMDYLQEVERAVDEIVEMNLTGNYKKVYSSE